MRALLGEAEDTNTFVPLPTTDTRQTRSSSRQAKISKAFRSPNAWCAWSTRLWILVAMLTVAMGLGVMWRQRVVTSSPSQDASLGLLCEGSPTIDRLVSGECCSPGHRGVYKLVDEFGAVVDMVFHAVSPNPFIKATLGLENNFGIVTNEASSTTVNVSFVSAEAQEPLTMPYLAISFYHLVTSQMTGSKSVRVLGNWTDAVVLRSSSLKVSHKHNSVTFKAGHANTPSPQEPQRLTVEQLAHAATVRFVNVNSFQIHFEVGAQDFHGFLFTTRAALLCNQLEEPVKLITNAWTFKEAEGMKDRHVVKNVAEALFEEWLIKEGDSISAGTKIYRVAVLAGFQEISSNAAGKVLHLQHLLPGDLLKPGLAMVVLDTSGIDWMFIGICIAAVLACLVLLYLCWRCCCRGRAEPEHPVYLDKVTLEFETESAWTRSVDWKCQPLGLGFYEGTMPMRVAYVGEDARHMGVVRGDVLTGAASDPSGMKMKVSGVDFENAWKDLKARVSKLPPAPRLVLRFQNEEGTQTLTTTWRTKPLGLHFSDTMPLIITEVLEEAAHLQLQVGDVLTGYGLEPHLLKSTSGQSSKNVLKYIYDHMQNLPDAPRLVLKFEKLDKSVEEFSWFAQPLGLRFNTMLPITVQEVRSLLADEKGVRTGYILRSFGDDKRIVEVETLVRKGATAAEILDNLQRFVEKMPTYTDEVDLNLLAGRV